MDLSEFFAQRHGTNGQQRIDVRQYLKPPVHEYSGLLGPDGQPLRSSGASNPRFDEMPIPGPVLFSAILGGSWRKYLVDRMDEARRNSYEDSLAMERDCFIQGIINERKFGTASLEWHLEVDNERDPHEKALKDGLTKVLKATPHLQKMILWELDAVYRGRSAVQLKYVWKHLKLPTPNGQPSTRRCLAVGRWGPINGDKINYNYDGTPALLVNAGEADQQLKGAHLSWATQGRSVDLLRSDLRKNFIIHAHEVSDADFFDSERGEAIYGIGLRHVLYWYWWLKSEWLANATDWLERAGLGVRKWYYQAGNEQSRQKVLKAAEDNVRRTNILIPRYPNPGGHAVEGMEYEDVATGGAEFLVKLIEYLDQKMERYVIGQTLSSDTEGSGLGGTGVSQLHANTKFKLIAFDANNLSDTKTQDFVEVVKEYTFPEYREIPVRWVFNLEASDPEKKLAAVRAAWEMGVTFSEDKVREPTGLPAPEPGDRPISKAVQDQAAASLQLQQQKAQADAQMRSQQVQGQQELAQQAQAGQQEQTMQAASAEQDLQQQQAAAVQEQAMQASAQDAVRQASTANPLAVKPPPGSMTVAAPFLSMGAMAGVRGSTPRTQENIGETPSSTVPPGTVDGGLLQPEIVDEPGETTPLLFSGHPLVEEDRELRWDGTPYAREGTAERYGILGEGGGGSESGAHLGQTPRKPSGAPQAPTSSAVAKPVPPPKPVKLPASPTAAVTPSVKPLLPPKHPHHALAQSLHQHLSGQEGPVPLAQLRSAFGHGKVDVKAPHANPVHGALMALRDAGHVQVHEPAGGFGEPAFTATPQPTEAPQATSHRSPAFAQKFHAGLASFQPDAHETGAQVPLHKLGPALGVPPEQLAQHLHALEQEGVVSLGHHDPSDFASLPPDPKYAAQEVARGRLIPDAQHPGHFISWLRYNAGPQGAAYRQLAQGQGVPGVQGLTPGPPQNTEESAPAAQQSATVPALKTPAVAGNPSVAPSTVPPGTVPSFRDYLASRGIAPSSPEVMQAHAQHGAAVKAALDQGQPVSEDVLQAHPNLWGHPTLAKAAQPNDAVLSAFQKLNDAAPGYRKNFVSLVDLRKAMPNLTREQQDQAIQQLRREGKLSLSAAEGRHGISAEDRAAGIPEEDSLLLHASVPQRYSREQYGKEVGRWITLGGSEGEDGKKHGGSPVYIENGRITKGHPGLLGKKIGALSEKAEEYSHRKQLQQGKQYERAKWAKQAKGEGVNPKHLHQLAGDLLAHHNATIKEHRGMFGEARKALEAHGGQHKSLHLDPTGRKDSSSIRGLDEVAMDMAARYPHLFRDENTELLSDQLFGMLRSGNPTPLSEAEAYTTALDQLRGQSISEEPGEAWEGESPQGVVEPEPWDAPREPTTLQTAAAHQTEDFFQPRTQQSNLFQEGGTGQAGHLGALVPDAAHAPLYTPNQPVTATSDAGFTPRPTGRSLFAREGGAEQYGALPIDVLALLQRLQRLGSSPQAVEFAKNLLALLTRFPDLRRSLPLQQFVQLQKLANLPSEVQSQYGREAWQEAIDRAAKDADPSPSEEQKAAGNYQKGHVTVQGLPITIENAKGSMRSGKGKDGKPWSVKMAHHYGYLKLTESEADGDHVDVFLGPSPESEWVYIVDQVKGNGHFDEAKCMLFFTNEKDARQGYLDCYAPGWKGLGAITPMSMVDFKDWLEHGDTSKPVAEGK